MKPSPKLPSIEDYMNSLSCSKLILAPTLKNGHCIKSMDVTIRYAGGFCVVFPFESNNTRKAIRCWYASLDNMQERTKLIAQELNRLNLPYFVKFEYITQGICTNFGIQPIVLMDWVNGLTLKEYMQKHINEPNILKALASDFKSMVTDLHLHNLSHGDLQHGNIMVSDDGHLTLVDYDSMYVPALKGYKDDIKGLEGYQPAARINNIWASPKADYFSELIIYLSILAIAKKPALWNQLNMPDTETMIFSAHDIASQGTSPIFNELKNIEGLKEYVDKLIEFTKCTSLNDILPLENAVKSNSDRILSGIVQAISQKPKIVHNDLGIEKNYQNITNRMSQGTKSQKQTQNTTQILNNIENKINKKNA